MIRLGLRPHSAREIWKRSLICTVRPSVYTNEAFRKRYFNRRNLKTPTVHFRVDGKHYENGHDGVTIITWFPALTEFSSNTNPKWPVIVAFSNSSSVVWTANVRCVFRVKTPFSNSCSVVRKGRDLSLFIFDKRVSTIQWIKRKKSWVCSDLRVQPDLCLFSVLLCLLWCSCEYDSKCVSTQVLWNLFEVFNKGHRIFKGTLLCLHS